MWFAFGVIVGMGIWASFGNQLKLNQPPVSEKIQLISIAPEDIVSSPLIVAGRARGSWFFEASFPIELRAGGRVLATGIAQAQGEWMTSDFVSFEAKLVFDQPASEEGELVFIKDNPSGLPENDDSVSIPVRFK